MEHELNERQKEILRYVICNFVMTAAPVASRYVAVHDMSGLSPATIRNTMADLEEMGYVTHPHTSAGRIPTDKGYRFFVDWLMEVEPVTVKERGDIRKQFDNAREPDEVFRQAAKLLGVISHQLSVVAPPHLRSAVLDHLELISVASNKIFVLLTVKTGIVKTITMEVMSEISQENLANIARLLNERLHGLTLETIRSTVADRVKDFKDEGTGLVNLFIHSADMIFDDTRESEKLHIGGTQSFVEQPEYSNPENFRTIIELLNNEGVLVEVLEKHEPKNRNEGAVVFIGQEHGDLRLRNYSIVVATYKIGGVVGKVGIIGPKRMHYAKVVPLVDYVANEVSLMLS